MAVSGINNYIKNDRSENIWQARIDNPDLTPNDRDLIQRFVKGEVSKQKLLDRYSFLYEKQIKNYDGKVSFDSSKIAKRISAFEWVLDSLIDRGKISNIEIDSAGEKLFRKYLKHEDKKLIEEYRRSAGHSIREREKARQAIIDRVLSYQDEIDGAIWGTPLKIEAYQRSIALQNIVPDAISEDEIIIASYLKAFGLPAEPPTGKEEREYWISWRDFIKESILPIEKAASSPEMIDDQEIKAHLRSCIKLSYAILLKYLQSKELDAQNIDQERTMMAVYIGFAGKIGISQSELEVIKAEVESSVPKPDVKQIRLNEIKQPLVVTPETLPQPIIHFLKKVKIKGMSGYQFVKENVNYIILNPCIKNSGSESITGSESPLGVAFSFIPMIEIDIYNEGNDEDKKAYRTALELINTIIHETFHVYWMKKHFNDPRMLSSAINEGVANLAGSVASKQLLESLSPDPQSKRLMGERSKEVMNNFEVEIKNDLATIGGAIQELGLNPKEVLSAISLPKFLTASLKGNDENDIETYPTLTPYAAAHGYLISLGVPKEESTRLGSIFEEVVKGKDLLSLDEKARRSVHKLMAKIEPRFGKMKYEDVIKELRELYAYYAWKDYKHKEESNIKSARAQYKYISNKDIEKWQNQSRVPIRESIQEVKFGKRDDQLLNVLVCLYQDSKRK